jgi:poly-gamma-glutamate synthesis protein (capsule biosynthesis protein)
MHPPAITVFLSGDVMTARGIDQILPAPGNPLLHEEFIRDSRAYIALAEENCGPITRPVPFDYIWGDALAELSRLRPDVRLINLETAVTTSSDYWRAKEVQYRMNPANLACLTAAGIDGCSLANNHVLDWGYEGLRETLTGLQAAGIATAGAGQNLRQAQQPAMFTVPSRGRILVFSFGSESSGIPASWAAADDRPGVWLLPDLSAATVRTIAHRIGAVKRRGDIVIASLHWGGNWGYHIFPEETAFAHRLIETAGVDIVHGHSSHHVKGIEVWRDRLILYGCGDLINDYEGIGGCEEFRGELSLLYLVTLDPMDGRLTALQLVPMHMRRLRLNRAGEADALWLLRILQREGERFGVRLERRGDGTLWLMR